MLDVWREFRNHKGAVAGAIIFFGIVLLVLIGPFLWPHEPNSIDIRSRNQGPSLLHPLRRIELGRDTMARIMTGVAHQFRLDWRLCYLVIIGNGNRHIVRIFKKLDGLLMRFLDLFLSLPLLPLLLVMMLFSSPKRHLGPEKGMFILIVVSIGVTSWMPTARIVRVMSLL